MEKLSEKEKKDLRYKLEGLQIDEQDLENTYRKQRDKIREQIKIIINKLYI